MTNAKLTAVVPIHELRITLRGTKPPIWRRIAVPADFTLAELHEIIQLVMGWMDGHLHQFRLKTASSRPKPSDLARIVSSGDWTDLGLRLRGERVFTDRRVEDMEGEDERAVSLADLGLRAKQKLLYEYDFGDDWEHAVELGKTYAPTEGVRYPVCLAGKGACPPEDCGGVWGYYEMLAALRDPKHPEHDERREWLGGAFDPDAFDLEDVNARLATWHRHPRGKTGRRGKRRGWL